MFEIDGLIEIISKATKEYNMKQLNSLSLNELIIIFYKLLLNGELHV